MQSQESDKKRCIIQSVLQGKHSQPAGTCNHNAKLKFSGFLISTSNKRLLLLFKIIK